jgi:hypothetical protein
MYVYGREGSLAKNGTIYRKRESCWFEGLNLTLHNSIVERIKLKKINNLQNVTKMQEEVLSFQVARVLRAIEFKQFCVRSQISIHHVFKNSEKLAKF